MSDAVDPELLGVVGDLVREVTRRPDLQVRADHAFVDDLGVDSLAMLELLVACQHGPGVAVADAAVRQLVHVGDLVDYLEHHRRR